MQVDAPIAIFKKQVLLSRQRGKVDPGAEEKIVLLSNRDLLYWDYNQFFSKSQGSCGQVEETKPSNLWQNSIFSILFGLLCNSTMMIRSVFMQITQAGYKMNEIIVKNTRWDSITIAEVRNNAGSHTENKKGNVSREIIWDMILEAGDEGKGEAEEKLRYVWLGWPTSPRLPRTFRVSALKVSHPGKPLSPIQTGTFRHPKIGLPFTYKEHRRKEHFCGEKIHAVWTRWI